MNKRKKRKRDTVFGKATTTRMSDDRVTKDQSAKKQRLSYDQPPAGAQHATSHKNTIPISLVQMAASHDAAVQQEKQHAADQQSLAMGDDSPVTSPAPKKPRAPRKSRAKPRPPACTPEGPVEHKLDGSVSPTATKDTEASSETKRKAPKSGETIIEKPKRAPAPKKPRAPRPSKAKAHASKEPGGVATGCLFSSKDIDRAKCATMVRILLGEEGEDAKSFVALHLIEAEIRAFETRWSCTIGRQAPFPGVGAEEGFLTPSQSKKVSKIRHDLRTKQAKLVEQHLVALGDLAHDQKGQEQESPAGALRSGFATAYGYSTWLADWDIERHSIGRFGAEWREQDDVMKFRAPTDHLDRARSGHLSFPWGHPLQG